jgi:hypothetical protein
MMLHFEVKELWKLERRIAIINKTTKIKKKKVA